MLIYTHEITNDMQGFGRKWHVASFSAKKEDRPEIARWCYQAFGVPGYLPMIDDIRWKDGINYGEIIFSRKQDLEWFILRWT